MSIMDTNMMPKRKQTIRNKHQNSIFQETQQKAYDLYYDYVRR